MQAPFRVLASLRGSTDPGLGMSVSVSMATFTATPLILPSVAERLDVGTGTAGLFSAAQLGAFVVSSAIAGRLLQPSRRLFVAALLALATANLVSAVGSVFELFVVMRGVAGLSLGVLAWLAYSQVFGNTDGVGDIAVIGPLTGVVAAPLFGLLLEVGDDRTVFWVLTAFALLPLVRIPHLEALERGDHTRNRAVPQALILVVALGIITLGGSAVFVFLGAIGTDQYGLDPFVISIVFAANAAASIPAARWRGSRPLSGAWLLLPAIAAVVIGQLDQQLIFWVLITGWGVCFWMAIPGIYNLLSARSRFPAERAGDAQASMAAGRALGPLLGGFVVSAGGFGWLGVTGGAVMATGAVAIVTIELLGSERRNVATRPIAAGLSSRSSRGGTRSGR